MKKYKIAVLSDLTNNVIPTLKSSISLAKMIDADINVYYVKKTTDIVSKENQLSAIRAINEDYTITKREMKRLISPMAKEYDIDINYHFTFGNIKNELNQFIKDSKPDIIIMGRRNAKALRFIGDNITQFVLDSFSGVVLITDDKNVLEPHREISLGILNNFSSDSLNVEFAERLLEKSQKPVKSFKVVKTANLIKNDSSTSSSTKAIEFVFEKRDNTVENIGHYLSKNNINLLCVGRNQKDNKDSFEATNLNELIKKLNVSLLLT